MDEKETVRLIQKYRHDLMNRLQIVSGYLSMEKTDKAKRNLDDVLRYYEEERNLMRLNADSFMIWILQFQDAYPSFALTYRVELLESVEKSIDEQELLITCKKLLAVLSEAAKELHVYDLFLHIQEKETYWIIRMHIKDVTLENMNVKNIEKQHGVSVIQEKEQTSFEWNIVKEERGD
ncbi:Spo0B domain-containing protein [Oceanobacillus jeddahense]|uniref:Spo0B domain-containing protein n=1 Tax=Oceanobacillus jeddahense TaxID=1462527 RepID=A0ABY5JZ88_9BACI|nr:Spo0B domain-containing protein [Oceanobacillus jeddahense]UUI05341.1 Spo0B domain-containing protein [Oceanobacillus jeddahense]